MERSAVRNSARSLLPKHAGVAGWTHRPLSFVEQEGVKPMPRDRGAEQRDVDGPLERTLPLGMVAAETRLHVAGQQAAGTVLWVGANSQEEWQRLTSQYQSHHASAPKLPNKWPRKAHKSG